MYSVILTAIFLHLDKLCDCCCNPREQLSVYDPDLDKRFIMVDGEMMEEPEDDVETPEDEVETPEDDVETPEDDVETPEDDVETPEDAAAGLMISEREQEYPDKEGEITDTKPIRQSEKVITDLMDDLISEIARTYNL